MLGLEKDPKLLKIRAENPLNKIHVPKDGIVDLDERIDQFCISSDLYHPDDTMNNSQLYVSRMTNVNASNTFNYT